MSSENEVDQFIKQQFEWKNKVICNDTENWQKSRKIGTDEENIDTDAVNYVAGLDISYLKSEPDTACVALVVCRLPSLQVVYKDCEIVHSTAKYVAGCLAAREAPFLVEAYKKLRRTCPELLPQALLIDGNGVLHPNECGIACVVGIELGLPTVGVAKNLFCVDGIEKDERHKTMIKSLSKKGDSFPLISQSGRVLGLALRSGVKSVNPVYISVGHNISLETAAWLVNACAIHKVPEPIRQADHISGEFLKKTFPDKE